MPKVLEQWTVQPHERPERVAEGILCVSGEIVMPLGRFPRRMTVVSLSNSRSAIWSAIALDEAGMAEVEAMGRPTFLIVPSDAHRMDAKIWKRRYFGSIVVTPPGAGEVVGEVVPVEEVGDVLDDPQVHFQVVPGTGGHESALVVTHDDGTTLIVNDVIAHVAHPHGIGANVMARLFGFGVSEPQIPRLVKSKVVEDKVALAQQFRAWAELPNLKRIIPSHGEILTEDPVGILNTLAESLE